MNFVVYGAGTIGCYLGGRLAASGAQVTLVGRAPVMSAIAQHGLHVTDLHGFDAHVQARQITCATDLKQVDCSLAGTVILLCVKSGATQAAAQDLARCCLDRTLVISFQNGVDNVARITKEAPRLEAVAGMVPYNVIFDNHQHVHQATAGYLHVHKNAGTEQLLASFIHAGLRTNLVDDMRAVQWGKLLLNLNNPVNALSSLPLREQLLNIDFRRVFAALQLEALRVMRRAGITPAQVTNVSPKVLPRILQLPNFLFTRVAKKMLKMDANARSSMVDDLRLGRVTEINDLCGAVVRLAKQHGTAAPLNQKMCELVVRRKFPIEGRVLRQEITAHN